MENVRYLLFVNYASNAIALLEHQRSQFVQPKELKYGKYTVRCTRDYILSWRVYAITKAGVICTSKVAESLMTSISMITMTNVTI